jgi:two-component system LytT family response regulator
MIRVVIVDDEPLARDGIRLLLAGDAEVSVVGEAAGARAAVAAVRRLRPDLVFLDVQLPDGDGFDVLADIPLADQPVVVFVTAYDRYALRAFDVHALDYLLKPFSDERFRDALRRAKARVRAAAAPPRLVIKDGARVVFLPVDEIDWIESADYYAQLHAGRHAYLLRESLASLAARLDPARFVRVHRRVILNRDRLREVRERGRAYVALLHDGTEVPVAREGRRRLVGA